MAAPATLTSTQSSGGAFKREYPPLNKQDTAIRLVHLDLATERAMPVQCHLEVVELRTKPTYEALSWSWGDRNSTGEILVDGQLWLVSANLVEALRYLRYPDRERVLWIDALSINQDSSADALREREHQIQLMKYVYSMACHVVVWMGVPDDELAHFVQDYLTGPKSLISGIEPTGARLILFIFRIQRFEWWKRIWVLQEVALASDATVYFGSVQVPFDRLLNELAIVKDCLRNFFERHSEGPAFSITALSLQSTYSIKPEAFYDLRELSSRHAIRIQSRVQSIKDHEQSKLANVSKPKAYQDFANCVVRFRYHQTSNPLDKLYGLLGLVPDLVGNELDPRYDEDVVCMYSRTALHLIRSTGSLYILSQARVPSEAVSTDAASLPSWVPDWTATPRQCNEWVCATYRESREKLFDASSGASCTVLTCDGNQTLGLHGVMIDVIRSCRIQRTPLPETFQEWWDQTQDWRELAGVSEIHTVSQGSDEVNSDASKQVLQQNPGVCKGIATTRKDDYIGGGKRSQAYWRTLVQNCVADFDKLGPPSHSISYSLSYEQPDPRQHGTYLRKLSLCTEDYLEMCDLVSQNRSPPAILSPSLLFAHLQITLAWQTFFVTEDGFMGVCPGNLEPGDQVWVLAGGSHPFILREDKSQPGHHKLVGEAYVDGVMLSGDINKPYASRLTREGLNTRSGTQDLGHNSGIWEEVWLR
jgi:Heterokaryon incompatibility protein (HET)